MAEVVARMVKMEKDYTVEVDEELPRCQTLAEVIINS